MKGQRTHTVPYLLPKSTATDRCPVPPHSARTCNWVSVLSRPGRRRGPSPSGRSRRHEQQCLQAAMTPSTRSPGPRPDWLTQQIVGRSLMQFRFRVLRGTQGKQIPGCFLRSVERVKTIWTQLSQLVLYVLTRIGKIMWVYWFVFRFSIVV